jgi:uncharacterized protein
MAHTSCELVQKAYAALGTGKKEECAKYWDQNMVWQVPGHNPLSGWYHGLDAFLGFMKRVGELSGGSFRMDVVTMMVNDDYSTDVTRNRGTRAGNPDVKLDIDVAHVLRWRNGKVVAGKGGIMGDGTDQYDHFWSTRV